MNWLEFIASIVQSIASLAWPAAIVACVFLFREKLISLLPLIYVKHKDWEASFRLDQAEKEAQQLPNRPGVIPGPTPEENTRFDQLALISPRAAILELRSTLDASLRTFAQEVGISNSERAATMSIVRQLRAREKIEPHVSAMLDDLRAVGNSVAHSNFPEPTLDDARRFRDLTNRVLGELEAARLIG